MNDLSNPQTPVSLWRARLMMALSFTPSVVLILGGFVPLVRNLMDQHTDWLVALNELHFRPGIVYGRDVIYTSGPLGFLWGGYHPRTFFWVGAFWTALALINWWAIWKLLQGALGHRSMRLEPLWMFLLVLPLGGDAGSMADMRLLLPALLLLLLHFFRADTTAIKLWLAAAMGFCGVIKFTCLVVGLVAIVIISLDQLLRINRPWKERMPLAAIVFLLTVAAAWLIGGQRLLDFPNYIRWAAEFAAGYSEAMVSFLPHDGAIAAVLSGAGLLLLALILLAAYQAQLGMRVLWVAAGVGFVLLTAFRHAIVRHDHGHELIFSSLLFAVAPISLLAALPHLQNRKRFIPAWIGCIALGAGLTWFTLARFPADAHSLPGYLASNVAGAGKETIEVARISTGHPSMLWTQWADAMVPAATEARPTFSQSMDGFSDMLLPLFRYGLNYQPRPTLQAHCAMTPALSSLNAARYAAPDGPQMLAVWITAIDDRLPAMEDNLCWLEILARYEVLQTGAPCVLRRRAVPRTVRLQQQQQVTLGLNNVLEFSAREAGPRPPMLWVQIETKRRPLAHLAAQVYKPDALTIFIRERSGEQYSYRLTPAIAAQGFLLGPVMHDNKGFEAVMQNSPYDQNMPVAIKITPESDAPSSWYFEDEMTVTVSTLTFDPPK